MGPCRVSHPVFAIIALGKHRLVEILPVFRVSTHSVPAFLVVYPVGFTRGQRWRRQRPLESQ